MERSIVLIYFLGPKWVFSRTQIQVRSHFQKYILGLNKKFKKNDKEFLENISKLDIIERSKLCIEWENWDD